MSEVTIHARSERPGKRPLRVLVVEVVLANPDAETRWYLVPSKLPVDPGGGVDKLEQVAASGATYGRFLGTGGFYAIALAPGARLTIKNLELAWWPDSQAVTPPPVDVRIASDVTLGGAAIASWFEGDPAIRGAVEIDADAVKRAHSHKTPDNREVAIATVGERRASVAIAP